MKNYIQTGDTLTVTAPAALASGDVVHVGQLVGIAATDAESGADVSILTRGVFELPKAAALAISAGDLVYWATAAGEVTKTNTDEALGVAVSTELAAATTVRVKIG